MSGLLCLKTYEYLSIDVDVLGGGVHINVYVFERNI